MGSVFSLRDEGLVNLNDELSEEAQTEFATRQQRWRRMIVLGFCANAIVFTFLMWQVGRVRRAIAMTA